MAWLPDLRIPRVACPSEPGGSSVGALEISAWQPRVDAWRLRGGACESGEAALGQSLAAERRRAEAAEAAHTSAREAAEVVPAEEAAASAR